MRSVPKVLVTSPQPSDVYDELTSFKHPVFARCVPFLRQERKLSFKLFCSIPEELNYPQIFKV